MTMLKSQLEAKVAELEADNREWERADEVKRENFSRFLGKGREEERYGIIGNGRDPLTWAEIYFELGKLKETVHQKDVDDKLQELSARVTYTQEELAKLKEEPLKEDEIIIRGGNARQFAGR